MYLGQLFMEADDDDPRKGFIVRRTVDADDAEEEKRHRANYAAHSDALETTGFWGAQGAGCIFFAQDTKRFLIAHRSQHVEQPSTWGSWGGAIDAGEDPLTAAKREASEENGYEGPFEAVPMYVFVKGTFRYSNFLIIVPHEFTPELDWETQGYVWTKFGQWPQPLHFGLVALFKDPASAKLMRKLAQPPKAKIA